MAPAMKKYMSPVRLFIVLLAVTLANGQPLTTLAITGSTTLATFSTPPPEIILNAVTTGSTTLSPSTASSAVPGFAAVTTATTLAPGIQNDVFTGTTTPLPSLNDSTTTSGNTTVTPPVFRPEDSVGGTTLDTQDSSTTTVPSTTPTVTSRTTSKPLQPAAQFTPSPPNPFNPYSNLLSQQRPPPLSPLTPQQLSPFLFAGSDAFPYMFLLSQQQANPQGPSNPLSPGLTPLYLTAMDFDLWPWMLAAQRPQQLTPQQQQQLGRGRPQPLPQGAGPGFSTQNQFPQGQTRSPQQIPTRNNLANLFWLNELYF